MNYHDKGNPNGYILGYTKDGSRPIYYQQMYDKVKQQMPTQSTLDLFPVDEGYYHGTIFRGLYKPYKNYEPMRLVPTNEKEQLLYDVDKYYFALHEMRMLLDDYPDNQDAINVFKEYQEGYIKAKQAYESKYGALDIEAPNLDQSPWNWTVGSWPWEGGK